MVKKIILYGCLGLFALTMGCAACILLVTPTPQKPAPAATTNRPMTPEEEAENNRSAEETAATIRRHAAEAAAAAPASSSHTAAPAAVDHDQVDAECRFGAGAAQVKNTGKVAWMNSRLTLNPSGMLGGGGYTQGFGALKPGQARRLSPINFADEDGARFNPYQRMVTASKLEILLGDGTKKIIHFH